MKLKIELLNIEIMIAQAQKIQKNLLVDIEGAHIEVNSSVNFETSAKTNSNQSIADMKSGKFQKMFNRHTKAFYRFN